MNLGWVPSHIVLALATLFILPGCVSKRTEENLIKIHTGMTTNEVKAILGDPSEVQTRNMVGLAGETFIYRVDDAEVKISFINDTLVEKRGDFQGGGPK